MLLGATYHHNLPKPEEIAVLLLVLGEPALNLVGLLRQIFVNLH